MFLSPEASRSGIRLFCMSLQWVSERVCLCVHARAQRHGIVNGFSHSILPVNSNMLHLPVSLTTVAPSCKKLQTLSFVLRTHFKLATLPLKSTKPKKKKNNKLKSSVNTWQCGLTVVSHLLTPYSSVYSWPKPLFIYENQLHQLYWSICVKFILRSNFEKSPEDKKQCDGNVLTQTYVWGVYDMYSVCVSTATQPVMIQCPSSPGHSWCSKCRQRKDGATSPVLPLARAQQY